MVPERTQIAFGQAQVVQLHAEASRLVMHCSKFRDVSEEHSKGLICNCGKSPSKRYAFRGCALASVGFGATDSQIETGMAILVSG